MRIATLVRNGLGYHARSHVAVALGVMVASATLTGALFVGDSMRGSLREIAVGRLGRVDCAVTAPRFFRARLVDDMELGERDAAPVILVRGGATNAKTKARAGRVNVIGTDGRFWQLGGDAESNVQDMPDRRCVILNEPLARELGAGEGDDVLIRVGKRGDVPTETLLGRRDNVGATLRLPVERIVPAEGLGNFSLNPNQTSARNAWIPMKVLQRTLDRTGRANAVLVAGGPTETADTTADRQRLLKTQLLEHLTFADIGLHLRVYEQRGFIALESDAMLISPALEKAAQQAAGAINAPTSGIQTYLANAITSVSGEQPTAGGEARTPPASIPYSVVAALDPQSLVGGPMTLVDGETAGTLEQGEILLNAWAARHLEAAVGDRVVLTYYVTGQFGALETTDSDPFTIRGIVAMDGGGGDSSLTPAYKGITDVDDLADWNPPFPMDFDRISERDEDYWDQYRAAPKAFLSLTDGRRLWAENNERFGRLTAIRIGPPTGLDVAKTKAEFESAFKKQLDLDSVGLKVNDIRAQALAASKGSTDFGMLFIGFSFFLIVSAAMLVALLFRLGAERRSGQIGMMLATGFTPRRVGRVLLAEGAVVAGLGGAVGVAVAVGYAWLMLAGLRTWWHDAVNAPLLKLHTPPDTAVIGFAAGLLVALGSIAWSVRGLTRTAPNVLLAGGGYAPAGSEKRRHRRILVRVIVAVSAAAATLLLVLSLTTDALPQAPAFFGSGAALLTAALGVTAMRLHREPSSLISEPGTAAFIRLGVRNAPRHAGRSLLTIGLIASATFIIAALQAFRLDADSADTEDQHSGTGGFDLVAESAAPIVYDLNTKGGRTSLGFGNDALAETGDMDVVPFRLRAGDETSCLNLYTPGDPRILGAGSAMIDRGGFRFSSTLASTDEQTANPWLLLEEPLPDGAIPVIGDEAAVLWQLHLGLGKDLVIKDEGGREVRLRFVALLAGSVLQSELVIAERSFTKLFPSITGHAFFLVDTPAGKRQAVKQTLERELAPFAFDATPVTKRLQEYLAVQNTYLSTFQTLGGLGLILGSVGLAVVLLRNVWERRGELALMRALGFSKAALGWIVLAENAALMAAGLLAGAIPALLAVSPQLIRRPDEIPWPSVALTILGVFLVGLCAGALACAATLRAPLLPALRRE